MYRIFAFLLGLSMISGCAPSPAPPAAPAEAGVEAAKPADPEWQKVLAAAKAEGQLVVYGLLLIGPEGTTIADEFKKDTGITVDFISGVGAPMLERIRQETQAGRPSADVFEGGQPWPSIVQRENLFVPLRDAGLPTLKEPKETWRVDPSYAGGSLDYVVSRLSGPEGHIVVNTSLISPADYPKSFHEIATDPKYRGKIAWCDPKSTGDISFKWTLWGYVTDSMSLEDVWSIFTHQRPVLFPDPVAEASAVGRGEAAINMGTPAFESLAEAGAPIKNLWFPDTPSVITVGGIGALKTAAHPNAALVFVDWVLSKRGQEVITNTRKLMSTRRDVPHRLPALLTPEVVGGGNKGPSYVVTGPQAQLAGEIHTGVEMSRRLPDGIGLDEYRNAVNQFIAQWETNNGGPQKQHISVVD